MMLKNTIVYLLYAVICVLIVVIMLDLGGEVLGDHFINVATLVISIAVMVIYILRRSHRKER